MSTSVHHQAGSEAKDPTTGPGGHRPRRAAKFFALALLLGVSGVFGLFAYNSGYGFDQLEYLVIGRSLVDGFPFYHFIPSKSFGIYFVVAALYRLGVPFGHVSLAVVISAAFLVVVLTTYVVTRRLSGSTAAWAAAALVALCSAFMEQNFLQTETFVALFGLAAFYLLLRRKSAPSHLDALGAGVCIGLAADFKSVAFFYAIAVALFLWVAWRRRLGARRRVLTVSLVASGAVIAVGLPALYFSLTGRFMEFWTWTIVFPLFHYPANTNYLAKLYTKLLGIHVLFLAALGTSLLPSMRRAIFRQRASVLALFMGAFSYLALFKTQASHYCFPGAVFLSIFTALVLQEALEHLRLSAGKVIAATAILAALVAASVVLYRPDAISRLFSVERIGAHEIQVADSIQTVVPITNDVLAFKHAALVYWVSHRYPPGRTINTAEQTTWYWRTHPNRLKQDLQSPQLTLVVMGRGGPRWDDPHMASSAAGKALDRYLRNELGRGYTVIPGSPAGLTYFEKRRE